MPDWLPQNLHWLEVPVRIAFLVLAALLARFLLKKLIARSVRRAVSRKPHYRFKPAEALASVAALPAERREQRISALGSIASSTVTLVVFLVAALMILTELGFNVTTIIAGTSVVAVTAAFGVQSVVKDLISGVFLLVEDQIGIGDWVDMDKASGEVEEVGLRVTQLRQPDGTVWYVRNGEVLRVGNFSQGGPDQLPAAAGPAAD